MMRIKWGTVHVPTSNRDWSVWYILDTRGNIVMTCLSVQDAYNYINGNCKKCTEAVQLAITA